MTVKTKYSYYRLSSSNFCSDFRYVIRKIEKLWRGNDQRSDLPEACWIQFPLLSFAHQYFSCEHSVYPVTKSTAVHCCSFFTRNLLSIFPTGDEEAWVFLLLTAVCWNFAVLSITSISQVSVAYLHHCNTETTTENEKSLYYYRL